MTAPVPDPATALALERLRGVVGEGFAEIKGSLALLVQRSDQTDQALGQHRADLAELDKRVTVLERQQSAAADLGPRVDALERGRWPLPTISALAAVLAVVVAVVPLLLH